MTSDRHSPPMPSEGFGGRRRSSFSSQPLADMFNRPSFGSGSPPNHRPGSISSAAAEASRRRLSLTTVGLSGATGNQASVSSMRNRGESISSSTSTSVDESPFEDGDGPSQSSYPSTPFAGARRPSFGVNAIRDARMGGNNNGRPSLDFSNGGPGARKSGMPSPPTAKGRDGFNFAENMRQRGSRTSISASWPSPTSPTQPQHRAPAAAAHVEPPVVKEMPKQVQVPDHVQERILKGDFYMD